MENKLIDRPEGDALPRLTEAHKAVLKDRLKVRALTRLVRTSSRGTTWCQFDGLVWGFALSSYSQTITVGEPDDEDGEAIKMRVDVWSFNTAYMDGKLITVCKEFRNFPTSK